MHTPLCFRSEIHVPGLGNSVKQDLKTLKATVDERNLTDMWDMMLMLDYNVANADDLSPETREEFYGIISLLLKAFKE
ncbi:hypothetical protein [Roseibium algae]|uniref:Uncharacterized protein n=1 Tax=Roseibium algae TaxID=3123038 RepID=A0ABU8TJZ4_9HYPH